MWKLGFRLSLVGVFLVLCSQVTGGTVEAKRWFDPNESSFAVERLCRNGADVSGVRADAAPEFDQIGRISTSQPVQIALYTNDVLPPLPSELDPEASGGNPFSAGDYGVVLAKGILKLIYQTTPFSYTVLSDAGTNVVGPFYDYTTLTLLWPQDLPPGTKVVFEGISEGLFYLTVQDCYINTVSYQGYLSDVSGPANGSYDFQFGIYGDPINNDLVGDLIDRPGVIITNGTVNIELPVSPTSFTGPSRWLEVRVKPTGLPTYTILSPRQSLLATPYALNAQHARFATTSGYASVSDYSVSTNGMQVGWNNVITFTNSIYIRSTVVDASGLEGDGLRICATGTRICDNNPETGYDPRSNGVEIGDAQHDGVHIIAAGDDGVQIGDNNLNKYPSYGLYIPDPGVLNTALLVNTANVNGEWALATPDKIFAGGGYFTSLSLIAQVAEGEALTPGDLVAASGLGAPVLSATNLVPQVRRASDQGLNGVIGVVEGRMTLQPEPGKAELLTLRSAEGSAQPGEYVALTVYGVAQVKAQAVTDGIVPGQRLTAAQQPGTARLLRTETLNGMMVSEGAPVVGIALAPVDPATGLVPVFVTLR